MRIGRRARARELVEWFFADMIAALAKDIPGAELVVVVEGEQSAGG